MANRTPRLPPVDPQQCDPKLQRLLDVVPKDAAGEPLRVFSTLAHHGPLLSAWLPFGAALLTAGLLPARTRELIVLRTAFVCGADYEWGHHVPLGLDAGLTEQEVEQVTAGPSSAWPELDRAVLTAVDELHRDAVVSDATWARLSEELGSAELVELVMLVGQYHMVGFVLNSAGVQLEPGYTGIPGR